MPSLLNNLKEMHIKKSKKMPVHRSIACAQQPFHFYANLILVHRKGILEESTLFKSKKAVQVASKKLQCKLSFEPWSGAFNLFSFIINFIISMQIHVYEHTVFESNSIPIV